MKLSLVALTLALSGCSFLVNTKPNEAEARCIVAAELREDVKLAQCGDDVTGECSTDAIFDATDREVEECLKRY